ncbi:MAG: DegT/DnrJ/EryC1/StrS family aminotransferase [Elusimicrobiota bacterium]|jgi:dTDP-4-amino-4,6-dideoxygalactose transaminase|nr:DegT/DnrJ/EryC1/StrS family aminotransferase [Elusimicrobiota bacterium]
MNTKNIPLFNLKQQHESIKEDLNKAALDALNSMQWLLGPRTKAFEENFAKTLGAKYCVACSSGASAIQIALMAAGVGRGDEVITTPFTFVATTTSVTLSGADFVFADIDPLTFNIDPKDIERKITKKTKAILPVHLYGFPADMDEILRIAKKYNLKVIEDCAQSHLAMYKNIYTGNFGEAAAFSFYPSKNLGACGDAGAVITNNKDIADLCQSIRHSGRSAGKAYEYDREGSTLRMDEIQAAILDVKLNHLKKWTEGRVQVAQMYRKYLAEVPQVILPPCEQNGTTQSYYVFTLRVKDRDGLSEHLKANNIGNAIYYPVPLYKQPCYSHLNINPGDFPHTEIAAKEVISVPIFPELTEEDVKIISDEIKEFYKNKR